MSVSQKFAPANEGVVEARKAEREAVARMAASKAAYDAAEAAYKADRARVAELMHARGARKFTVAGEVIVSLTEATSKTFDRTLLFKLAPKAAKKAERLSTFERLSLPRIKA